ncbi:hypothetical protein ASF30_12385 [Leifsonia sp. Leaf264]|nr:hypothetical protein ASF30_12385 [Leifsonia sp. Leaf264]
MTVSVDGNGDHHSVDGKYTEHVFSQFEADALQPSDPYADDVYQRHYDKIEDRTKAVQEELARRVGELANDDNWNAYLRTMSKFHHYSPNNQLLIMFQRPDATRVAGSGTWKSLGRYPKAGEKGIVILAGTPITKTKKDSSGNDVEDTFWAYKSVKVFDVSQTDGDPLPEAYEELTEEPPAGFQQAIEQEITGLGFTVAYEPIAGNAHGFTRPSTKQVVVDARLSPAERVTTLAHELGHIKMGHLERLDEYHTGHNGGKRGVMEVEAESFSYVLSRSHGMSPQIGGAASTYVAGWSMNGTDTVKDSAKAVSKAVAGVLADGPLKMASPGKVEYVGSSKPRPRKPAAKRRPATKKAA